MNLIELFKAKNHDAIVCDIDGVLFDFVRAWLDSKGYDTDVNDVRDWDFYRTMFNMSQEDFEDSLYDVAYNCVRFVMPFYAAQVQHLIHDTAVPVRFVTSRHTDFAFHTNRFLDALALSNHGELAIGITNKADFVQDMYDFETPFIIEDSNAHVLGYTDTFKGGTVVVPAHPYNYVGTDSTQTNIWTLLPSGLVTQHEGVEWDNKKFTFPSEYTDWDAVEDAIIDDTDCSQAMRYNTGKPELHYLFTLPKAAIAITRVFEQGATKYEQYNYLKGNKPDVEYIDAALRHIERHLDGEIYDPDIGTLHIANAAWNLMALLHLNMGMYLPISPGFDQEAFVATWET